MRSHAYAKHGQVPVSVESVHTFDIMCACVRESEQMEASTQLFMCGFGKRCSPTR